MAQNPPSLGARIRRARELARLSQEDLAKAVGASVRAISDWENDKHHPRNRLGVLEEVLGVDLGDEPEEPELPTPEDLDGLREHAREVLGPRAAVALDAIDRALADELRPNGGRGEGAAGDAAGSARRQAGRQS